MNFKKYIKKINVVIISIAILFFLTISVYADSRKLVGKIFCIEEINFTNIFYELYSFEDDNNIVENQFLERNNFSSDGKIYSSFNEDVVIKIDVSTLPIGYGLCTDIYIFKEDVILINLEKVYNITFDDGIEFFNEHGDYLVSKYDDSLYSLFNDNNDISDSEQYHFNCNTTNSDLNNDLESLRQTMVKFENYKHEEYVMLDDLGNQEIKINFCPAVHSVPDDYLESENQITGILNTNINIKNKTQYGYEVSTDSIYNLIIESIIKFYKFMYNKFNVIPFSNIENNLNNLDIFIIFGSLGGKTYHDDGQYLVLRLPYPQTIGLSVFDIVFVGFHEVAHLFEHKIANSIDNLEDKIFNEAFAEFVALYYAFLESSYYIDDIPTTIYSGHVIDDTFAFCQKYMTYDNYYMNCIQRSNNLFSSALSNYLFLNENGSLFEAVGYCNFIEIKSLYDIFGEDFWDFIYGYFSNCSDMNMDSFNQYFYNYAYNVYNINNPLDLYNQFCLNNELNECFLSGNVDLFPLSFKNFFVANTINPDSLCSTLINNHSVFLCSNDISSLAKQSYSRFLLNDTLENQEEDLIYNLNLTYYCDMRISLLSKSADGEIETNYYYLDYNGQNNSSVTTNLSLLVPKNTITYLFVSHNGDLLDSTTFTSAVMDLSRVNSLAIESNYDSDKIYNEVMSTDKMLYYKKLHFEDSSKLTIQALENNMTIKLLDNSLDEVFDFTNNQTYNITDASEDYYLLVLNNSGDINTFGLGVTSCNSEYFYNVTQTFNKTNNSYNSETSFKVNQNDFYHFDINKNNVSTHLINIKQNNSLIYKFGNRYYPITAEYTGNIGNVLLEEDTLYTLSSTFSSNNDNFKFNQEFKIVDTSYVLDGMSGALFVNEETSSDFVYHVQVGDLINRPGSMKVISGYPYNENYNSSYLVMIVKKINNEYYEVGGFEVSDSLPGHTNYYSFNVNPGDDIYVYMNRDITIIDNYIEVQILTF